MLQAREQQTVTVTTESYAELMIPTLDIRHAISKTAPSLSCTAALDSGVAHKRTVAA